MYVNVLIGCCDVLYGERLTSYLLKSKNNQLNISLVTTIGGARSEIETGAYGLIVLDENMFEALKLANKEDIKPLIILTEATTSVNATIHNCVLKYQKASFIEAHVLTSLLSLSQYENIMEACKKTKVIAFYSPSGGSGNTILSQIYAHILGCIGKKVFYLSLDQFTRHDLLFGGTQPYNLSDYLVYQMTHHNWLSGLKQMASRDVRSGVEFLRPAIHQYDMDEVSDTTWLKWLQYMKGMSGYDYVVIDLGLALAKSTVEILKLCDERFYIMRHDVMGQAKWQSFHKQLKDIKAEIVLDTCTVICNKIMAQKEKVKVEYDHLFQYDETLLTISKEGQISINHLSKVYKQMERILSYES